MPKRGETATPAQRAALVAGRKVRDQAKAEARAKAKASGAPTANERWAMLVSGTITMEDLDDQEISRMRVRGKSGGFDGKARKLPSHLATAFHAESIKRANAKLNAAAPEAIQALLDIGRNPDVREGDRVRALIYVADRALGKTPENVNIKADDPWAATLHEGGSMREMRDLGDLMAEVAEVEPEDAQ